MAAKQDLLRTGIPLLVGLAIGSAATWPLVRKTPETPTEKPTRHNDAELVRQLLAEDLTGRTFSFATVAEATSGKRVVPLDDSPPHRRIVAAIESALATTLEELNQPDSPVRNLRRINEASWFFEKGLMARIDAMPGLACGATPTRSGIQQRSGYPDLRIVDEATGTICYLDPKLVEQGSAGSTFRTFYFEPKNETLKITDDAIHLLAGIEHDGVTRRWTFTGWRLVDLSTLQVRLKAEFQASNKDLYQNNKDQTN